MGTYRTLQKRWFGKIGMISRLFWTSMLAIHVPLTVRCFFGLFHQGGLSEHLVSFIALAVSSAFFVLKLGGLRLTNQKLDWRKTVAFCVLGAILHVLVFSPTLMENRYNLSLILSVSVTLTVILAVVSIARVATHGFTRTIESRFWAAFLRANEWILLACLPTGVLLSPALASGFSRRGPPQPSFPYRFGN